MSVRSQSDNNFKSAFYLVLRSIALILCLCTAASAGEAIFLAIQAEGTASVIISEKDKMAYVTDGGKRGTGISKALINGKPVLRDLLDRGMEVLVITCTHPHADHEGGLLEMVSRDSDINKFKRLVFVDSGYGNSAKRLYDTYEDAWSKTDDDAKPRREYRSAENSDAFDGLASADSDVVVNNFVYQPAAGAHPHGHSLIVQYEVRGNGKSIRIVDFDDANTLLLNRWAAENTRADVVILSHHGSQENDMSSIIAKTNVSSCIITVTPANQFRHPGPVNVRKFVDKVGIGNVHFTGATAGQNVVITENGVLPITDKREIAANYSKFIEPQKGYREGRISELEERIMVNITDSRTINRVPRLTRVLEFEKANYDAIGVLGQVMTGQPIRKITKLGPSYVKAIPPTQDASDHSGGYSELRERNSESAKLFVTGQLSRESAKLTRQQRFAASKAWLPDFGGVVVNGTGARARVAPKAKLKALIDTEIVEDEDEGEGQRVPFIEISVGSQQFRYEQMSTTELWTAYNLLAPSTEVRSIAPYVDRTDCGLVGIFQRRYSADPTLVGQWDFGVHPAIVDTVVARDAMRLDQLISFIARYRDLTRSRKNSDLTSRQEILSAYPEMGLLARSLPREGFFTYQWFDTPAIIGFSRGTISVEAANGLASVLLRVRLVRFMQPCPEWAKDSMGRCQSGDPQMLITELGKRLAVVEAEDSAAQASPVIDPSILRSSLDWQRALDRLLQPSKDLAQRRSASIATIANQLSKESIINDYSFNRLGLQSLYTSSDALRRINRVAKVMALLSWIRARTGKLPPLPPEVRPTRFWVPPKSNLILEAFPTFNINE